MITARIAARAEFPGRALRGADYFFILPARSGVGKMKNPQSIGEEERSAYSRLFPPPR
jgi:hypothetical protein